MNQLGLVLQGGGALGAYEFGVLRRLFKEPDFKPDIISGVSIGAINAAVLVGARNNDPIGTLNDLWERFEVFSPFWLPNSLERFISLFGNLSFFRMRLDYFNMPQWTSFYNTDLLRGVLSELVNFEKINQSEQRLLLTATNIRTGKIEIFDNRNRSQGITIDHVIASGCLPPGFPITTIKGESYWDGGLFDNTPLKPAIEAFDTDPNVHKKLIVINLFPAEGKVPSNMLDVFDRTFEIIFSNKIQGDVKLAQEVNEYVEVIKAIDAGLPSSSPVRKLPGYKRLQQYKIISEIVYINNENPELVFGPFDFSRASISKRSKAGYKDADKALLNPNFKVAGIHKNVVVPERVS